MTRYLKDFIIDIYIYRKDKITMARRPKNLSIEELISNKENEIENLSSQLKTAKAELKQLKEEKLLADSQRIMDALAASGKSVDDVINMINQ